MQSCNISPREALEYKTIAVVGASENPDKEAHLLPAYLQQHWYRIIPVNPTADVILGEKAYPSILELPEDLAREVEVVEVFRPSEELPAVARQVASDTAKERYGRPFVFWAQLGLENDDAEEDPERIAEFHT